LSVSIFLLDVPENLGILKAAEQDSSLTTSMVGPYFQISGDLIYIDRRSTECRHAVWYSAVAGTAGGRVTQLDKEGLKVEGYQ
jgi:hypothetical protein